MVWLVWVYTTWVTNWLDPDALPVRVMLLVLSGVALVMSAALPEAFGARGLAVGVAYATMQIGRSILRARCACATTPSNGTSSASCRGACSVAPWRSPAASSTGRARAACWLAAVGIDMLGGAVGFYTPGLGRSRTQDWAIEGNYFAERCQAFILIAVGESVVVIGATLSDSVAVRGAEIVAFVIAFIGSITFWWLYFDRSADDAARVVAASPDPGRLGRSAYHWIHPVMVAGIIVTAAADQRFVSHPTEVGSASTTWMVLGGGALFLAGHAAFEATVFRVVPWSRLAGIAALAVLAAPAAHLSAVALGGCAAAVVVGVAVADRLVPMRARTEALRPTGGPGPVATD